MVRLLVLVSLAASACYAPSVAPDLPCGELDACPYGLTCDRGVCVSSPADPDAAVDDAAVDGAIDGAPVAPSWRVSTPLPSARTLGCLVAHGGRLYHLGGSATGVMTAEVLVAPIQGDGAVGAWQATTSLPEPNRWHACAVDPARAVIYVTGGDAGVRARATVLRAAINIDGTLGAWEVEAALPDDRRGHGVVIVGGYIHVLGGEEADGFAVRDTVFSAAIGDSGIVGAWSTSTVQLPLADYMFGTALVGDRVFLTGGYRGGDQVVTAAFSGGAIAPLVATTALPADRERHVSVATASHVYVYGGEVTFGGTNYNSVLRAPVAGATLGAWEPGPAAPYALAYAAATSSNGWMYVAGGADGMSSVAHVLVYGPL